MKIGSGVDHMDGVWRTSNPAGVSGNFASAPAIPATPSTSVAQEKAKPADFSLMTRQEMRDWVNDQLRDGKMSFEDSSPFMAMTMKVSLDGNIVDAQSDSEPIDFVQKIRDGIEGASSRKDSATLKMLRAAMQVLQSQSGSIDTHA